MIIIQWFAFTLFQKLDLYPICSNYLYSIYLLGLKAETDPRFVYSWLVLQLLLQIWDLLSSFVYFQLLICHQASFWIKHLLKFHFKTWKVPSNCKNCSFSVCFLFVCFLPSLLSTWNFNSLYELENISVLKGAVSWVWWHANHFDDLRHCSHSQPITHCHHSSDSVLRLWYRCIFLQCMYDLLK